MFEDIFSSIQKKNPEVKIVGVWGKDGLELEKSTFSELDIDLEFTAAEVADIISKIDGIKILPDHFYVNLAFSNHYFTIFSLTSDYFLIVISDQKLILGKLQFYMSMFKEKIIKIL